MSDSIKVAIKVRPLIRREKDDNLPIQWIVDENSIVSTDSEMKKRGDGRFYFDHIFDMDATNSDVFDTIVKPIVNAAVNGFNGTVFAYGQTSSGKTYTMMGTPTEPGILPLAIDHMFDAITNSMGREFLLRVSYLEIYNERVHDLLNKDGADLKLKEDSSGQVTLQCKEEITNSPENVLSIMKWGDKHRRIGETNMNERSSRSHTIFRITIESRETGDSDSAIQVSQLNLVDLAGSERARQTGATGERFKEGRHINMSLSTLGLVIMQLSESQDSRKYVNFRDSKLTRLLQNSLGGNALTAIICAVTPAALDETQCTLSFASRAKSVKNKPQVNEVMSDSALLKRYARQLTKLQEELKKIKTENRVAEVEEMESKLLEKDRINQLLEERIELLKTRIVSGDKVGSEDSFKHKAKRRQTWGGPGMVNDRLPVFKPKAGLPTVKEVSDEESHKKSIIQSIDIMNQTFQTAFTDFELELFKSERDRENRENTSDSDDETFVKKCKNRVTFRDDVMTIRSENNSLNETPEKCNTATQTSSCQISPSTPKHVLRRCITNLQTEYAELQEFTILEKQMFCQENHCTAFWKDRKADLIEAREFAPKNCEVEYAPYVKERLASLDLAEEKNLNRIIDDLCRKLNELEEQNTLEKETNRKTMKQFSELEKRIENITSERNEFEYISSELRTDLKKKTRELELKNISEESIREEVLEKVSDLEKQVETITSEKKQLERVNSELRAATTKEIAKLQTDIQNITSERIEFEHIRRELYTALNKKTVELEELQNLSRSENIEQVNNKIAELTAKIQNITSEKNKAERLNADLRSEMKQMSSEFELKISTEQAEKQEAMIKRIEQITMEKNQQECANVELSKRIADLESKIESERATSQNMISKLSELQVQITNVIADKNELERNNKELQLKLDQETSAKLEAESENAISMKNQFECIITDLRGKLNQNVSELESKQTENRKAMEKIIELNKQFDTVTSALEQKGSELESAKIESQKALEKIAELNKQLEVIISERDALVHVNKQLSVELAEKTVELQSMGKQEDIESSEAEENVLEAMQSMEDITSEANADALVPGSKDRANETSSVSDEINKQEYNENNNLKQHIKNLQEIVRNLETANKDLKDQLGNQSLSCTRFNESNADTSSIIVNMEAEKSHLEETLQLKSQELEDIQNDVRSLKTDIKKLQETVYLLTTENMEMATKLTTEQENAKQAELNLQKTIDELYARISDVMKEKITLESDLAILNEELESMRSKMSMSQNTEQVFAAYQCKIDKLTVENIELSTCIAERNKELENIKESKSLLYNHECIFKEKVAALTEKNESLISEITELSTGLMDQIEENNTLKEQYDILKSKMEQSLVLNDNVGEDTLERLKGENCTLRAEVAELKRKVSILSEENAKFTDKLLDTMETLEPTCREKSNISKLHLSTIFNSSIENGEVKQVISEEESREVLLNKITTMQDEIEHLTVLNRKLSDLKLTSCGQCAHLRNLNESRRTLKLEAKMLNQKLEDLQRKYDQKCADTEILKKNIDRELNSSNCEASANNSIVNETNVTIIEDKIQNLNEEVQSLKTDHDKLLNLYEDKCNELQQLQSGLNAHAFSSDDNSESRKKSNDNLGRIEQIQNYIGELRNDINEMKRNGMNFTVMLNECNGEKMNLLEEINNLKRTNEEVLQKLSSNEIAATNKIQILENELTNMSKQVEDLSQREKELESQRLMLEVALESLKDEQQSKNVLIAKLNEHVSSLKNEASLIKSQRNELINSQTDNSESEELHCLREQLKELEEEKVRNNELIQINMSRIKELEAHISELQVHIKCQETSCSESQEKGISLQKLLVEREAEKSVLTQKLQAVEMQATEMKNNLETKYKSELNTMYQKYQQHIQEVENNLQRVNETLTKYTQDNLSLTEEVTSLRGIKEKFDQIMNEKDLVSDNNKTLIDTNEKLNVELNDIKKCIIKELKPLKYDIDSPGFSSKPVTEIFVIFLQTLVAKEQEIMKTMRATCEKERLKLEDDKQQCIDAEKRATLWSKELEADVEKLQTEAIERERVHKEYENKICQLEHILKESTCEKEMLLKKLETLEMDLNNLQAEFDKICKVDSKQEEAVVIALRKEREAHEILKNKEMELQLKLKCEKEMYEQKVKDLVHTIESYKAKNVELNNTIESLELNERQLKHIIEANSTEIKRHNQNTERISSELEQLSRAYNEVNQKIEQKNLHIEEITAILKSKCDMLSEYKSKLDAIMPEYEMLKEHVKDKKATIEKCKQELEVMRNDREEQLAIIRDKLNSEEIMNVGLRKQLNELNNKNVALLEELRDLKERYEELERVNAKLEKKIRNSTSKIKAEAEMEELKEFNKKLKNDLEGASNRVKELHETKNQTLKELVDLKGKYELISQENNELKAALSSYKMKQSSSSFIDEEKYNALLLEKNKFALELEGNKIVLSQKDKQIKEYVNQIEELTAKNKELDEELDDYAKVITERDSEIAELESKLYSRLTENVHINELEEKLQRRAEENKKLQGKIEGYQIQLEMKEEEMNTVIRTLKKENLELQRKIGDYKKHIEMINANTRIANTSDSTRYKAPLVEETNRSVREKELSEYIIKIQQLTTTNKELNSKLEKYAEIIRNRDTEIAKIEKNLHSHVKENEAGGNIKQKLEYYTVENSKLKSEIRELQMKSRIDMHNERSILKENTNKQNKNIVFDKNYKEHEEKCDQLKKKIRELELQLVSKNGKIATLEIQIQSENFPYQKKCKELEEVVLAYRNKNAQLNSDIRKLQRTVNDINTWECDICRRWRVNRRDQACQTIPNDAVRLCSTSSGIVEDHVKIQKLEKEKLLMKDLCRARSRQIKELEDRLKELEAQYSQQAR